MNSEYEVEIYETQAAKKTFRDLDQQIKGLSRRGGNQSPPAQD